MESISAIPQELRSAFQRLLPYMSAGLREDINSMDAIVLYYKLGGEKLARIAIDAYNQTYRLKYAQLQKLRLEAALMAEQLDGEEEDEEEDEDEEEGEGEGDEEDKDDEDGGDY